MILKQGHKYEPMPHDGKLIAYIYRGGRCYYIASPYSLAATQALKAAFPQYWTAIRDYGYAHPQLVPFINEDPMLYFAPRIALSEASGKTLEYVLENVKDISIAVYGGTSAVTSHMEVHMNGVQVYNKLQSETAYGNSGSADGVSLEGVINVARMNASADWWRIKSLGYVMYDGVVYANQEQILNIPRSATRQEFSLIGMAQP